MATSNYGLQPGILMYKGERMRTLESTLDMTSLMTMKAPEQPTDLGILEFFAQRRRAEVPWLQINGLSGTNIKMTGDWAQYSTPAKREVSTRITEDLSTDANAGRGKTLCEMEITGKYISQGQHFKFDGRAKGEYRVESNRDAGDHQVISYRRVDSNDPVDKTLLQRGNTISIISSSLYGSNEFGQDYGDFRFDMSSGPKYRIPVGQVEARVKYAVTKDVAHIDYKGGLTIPADVKKAMDSSIEYYFSVPGVQGDKIMTLEQAQMIPQVATTVQNSLSPNTPADQKATVVMSTLLDSLALKYLNQGDQEYALWGTGGTPIQTGGYDESMLPVGIWQQLDTGYKITFNIANFGMHTLESMYREYMAGKWTVPDEGAEPVLIVQTGLGGFRMAQKMIKDEVKQQSLLVMMTDYNQITGTGPNNLGYSPLSYTSIRIPFVATFKFQYNPGFDTITDNPQSNPLIGGYRLSSYSMIITPENVLGAGNIKILRNEDNYGGQVFMNVKNGRGPGHPLFGGTQQKGGVTATMLSDLQSGYQCYFYKALDTYWVEDPTQVLKAVPINPITGLAY